MLYIPTGDGGSGGDPQGYGQNLDSLLGKILRIDVDGGDPYAVPPDNPFVGRVGTRPEIWAYGLRNPWRVAFDHEDDLLYVADVGQGAWEEVSVVAADEAGLNYGWNRMEGTHCFPSGSDCDRSGLTLPVVEYPHAEGISVTGGYVYRGTAIPELQGQYLYADFGRPWIRAFRYRNGQATDARTLEIEAPSISSFGVDGAGELYVVSLAGRVLKVVPDA
jgi:glucose/arabinose dehydrogenase